jgi:hypothetical protein
MVPAATAPVFPDRSHPERLGRFSLNPASRFHPQAACRLACHPVARESEGRTGAGAVTAVSAPSFSIMTILLAATLAATSGCAPGMPDRTEREWADVTKVYCAVSRDRNPNHDMGRCIRGDMAQKQAAFVKDLRGGEWRGMRP